MNVNRPALWEDVLMPDMDVTGNTMLYLEVASCDELLAVIDRPPTAQAT